MRIYSASETESRLTDLLAERFPGLRRCSAVCLVGRNQGAKGGEKREDRKDERQGIRLRGRAVHRRSDRDLAGSAQWLRANARGRAFLQGLSGLHLDRGFRQSRSRALRRFAGERDAGRFLLRRSRLGDHAARSGRRNDTTRSWRRGGLQRHGRLASEWRRLWRRHCAAQRLGGRATWGWRRRGDPAGRSGTRRQIDFGGLLLRHRAQGLALAAGDVDAHGLPLYSRLIGFWRKGDSNGFFLRRIIVLRDVRRGIFVGHIR